MQEDRFEQRRKTAYESASETFARLATTFGLPVDQETHERLRAIFCAAECVDRYFDDPGADQQMLSRSIPSFLEEHETNQQELPDEMRQALHALTQQVLNATNRPEFVSCVSGMLQRGILMHTTTNESEYLKASEKEGELAGNMIAITIGSSQRIWRNFLRDLLAGVTILDKICDARHDFENGEIAMRPSTSFYRQAWTIFARRMWRAFLTYPDKLHAFRRLLKLLNWYRHSE